jgi:hypothetical protein
MGGHWEVIGDHKTFIPPFVNERFDGPPFWACTYTALLIGANVGYLGRLPATHKEIRRLANASGDKDLRGGSRLSHMRTAMAKLYGETIRPDNVGPREARRRLGSGWAMVCGVTYGELPSHYRRWSPRFKLGHRMVVLGLSRNRTLLIDPMAKKPESWRGELIAWDDFAAAWWRDEQIWFREGQYVSRAAQAPAKETAAPAKKVAKAPEPPPVKAPVERVLQRFDEPRLFRLATGTTVRAYRVGRDLELVRKVEFTHPSNAAFDALVAFEPTVTLSDAGGVYLRVVNGAFAERYVPLSTPGLVAQTGAETAVAVAAIQPKEELAKDELATAILQAKREEYARIAAHLLKPEKMPPPPEG